MYINLTKMLITFEFGVLSHPDNAADSAVVSATAKRVLSIEHIVFAIGCSALL